MQVLTTMRLQSTCLTLLLGLFAGSALAAGGNYSSDADLEPIIELIEQGDYDSAINQLHDELDVDPDNADIMSLLGFSYRKTRNYEDAQTFYEWALRADPDHLGANEYLGELYLETNRFDKAVIFTDGYASMTEENQAQLKQRAFRTLTLLFGGRTDSPAFETLGDVVQLKDVIC